MIPTPVLVVQGTLPCNDCGLVLGIEEFNKNRERKCGYDRACRSCKSIRKRAWRDANLDRVTEYQAEWRRENADALREYELRRYRENAESERARAAVYRACNPGKRALWQQDRRSRELGVQNTLTDAEWNALVELYEGRCLACGRDDLPLTRDHIVPLVMGGALSLENTQPLCRPCNSSKKTKVIDYRPVAA